MAEGSRPNALRSARIATGGLRADQAVASCFPEVSRREARAALAAGRVFIDGRRVKVASRTVPQGARLVLHAAVEPSAGSASGGVAAAPGRTPLGRRAEPPAVGKAGSNEPTPEDRVRPPEPKDVPVLYEDDGWLVIDKPAGWAVNVTETSPGEAVVERFADRDARLVHRLDKGTSGVMVLAKGRESARELSLAFADRRVEKVYWAVVEGEGIEGRLEAPIGRDRRRPRARAVQPEGKPARTDVRTLGHNGEMALVEARPYTGRTHQIRAHLANADAPIVGDTLYGGPAAIDFEGRILRPHRPLLHALVLVLPHPGGQKRFLAPLPPDIAPIAVALGVGAPMSD